LTDRKDTAEKILGLANIMKGDVQGREEIKCGVAYFGASNPFDESQVDRPSNFFSITTLFI